VIFTYAYSPKLLFNAAISQRKSEFTSSGLAPGAVQADQNSTYATLSANYRITPLTTASVSYSYSHQKNDNAGVQSGLGTTDNLFLLSLNYQR
jgi:predicted porin